jgi:hypothetical protein
MPFLRPPPGFANALDEGQQAASPPALGMPLPPPASGREGGKSPGVYAPQSLSQRVGIRASSTDDCERLFPAARRRLGLSAPGR